MMSFKIATIQTSVALFTLLNLVFIVIINSRIWTSRVIINTNDELAKLALSPESTITAMDTPNLTSTRFSSNEVRNNSGQVKSSNQSLARALGPPISKPKNCQKRHCEEYTNRQELSAMRSCLQDTARRFINGNLSLIKSMIKENDCSFMDGSRRRPVALASTEGSGNTWIRGLLEKTTGICTGFIYCDYVMRKEGFIGEMIKSGSVIVVKTHTISPQWYGIDYPHPKRDEPYYSSAVFIVRNPYNALIAEWNRRATNGILIKKHLPHNESHTNVVPKEYWDIPEWDKFLHIYIDKWKLRLVNWVLNSSSEHPVHVVRYEDLKKNTASELAKILKFLRIPYSEEDLLQRLQDDFTKFKRKHVSDNFEHYSSSQVEHIRTVLLDTIKLAESTNSTELLRLEEYLP